MKKNRLKELFADNKTILNSWLTIPSSWTAELIANTGFDAVTIDMQHGLIDYQISFAMLQGISTSNAVPIIRIPWNEPTIIMKMLDAGAFGVICPMINNKEEAELFVQTCRYPPRGFRSYGPTRASVYAGKDYFYKANEEILTFVMIETAEGLENVEQILSVEGIDGVYIGTVDLSISMGLKGLGDLNDKILVDAIKRIMRSVKENGLIAGMHASIDQIPILRELGIHMITPITDGSALQKVADDILNKSKKMLLSS